MRRRKTRFLSCGLLSALLAAILVPGCRRAGQRTYEFQAPGLKVEVDGTGAVSGVRLTGPNLLRPMRAFTRLRDCQPVGPLQAVRSGARVRFQRKWVLSTTGDSCLVTDRFSLGNGSLRWDVEVNGLGMPWSTPIETVLVYPAGAEARFWTAWVTSTPVTAMSGGANSEVLLYESVAVAVAMGHSPAKVTSKSPRPLSPVVTSLYPR